MNTFFLHRRLAIAACASLAIFATAHTAAADLQEHTVLMPAPPTLPAFSPWVIAQARGYYAAEGIKLNLVAAKGGGVDVAKQVGAGNAIAGSSTGDTPIFVRPNGVPVKVVAVLGGRSLMQIAVWADNDKIKVPADFRGKTLTVASYQDSVYYNFIGMLAKFGMTKHDVNVQAAGPGGVWQLFAAKKADAMIGTPDWTAAAIDAGAKVKLFFGEEHFQSFPAAIVVSDESIRTRPELVAKIVRATLRGMRDVMNDPEGAAREFVAAVPSNKGRERYVETVIKSYAENVFPGQKILGKVDVERLKKLQDFYLKENLIEKAVPLTDFYTDQFIQ